MWTEKEIVQGSKAIEIDGCRMCEGFGKIVVEEDKLLEV